MARPKSKNPRVPFSARLLPITLAEIKAMAKKQEKSEGEVIDGAIAVASDQPSILVIKTPVDAKAIAEAMARPLSRSVVLMEGAALGNGTPRNSGRNPAVRGPILRPGEKGKK